MEKKVKKAFDNYSDKELKGKYYPLDGMTKETQNQLIADHFLFKEGDRHLQHANACNFWPKGRGIFHNNDKTFLIWVNEEDHLRIISMQQPVFFFFFSEESYSLNKREFVEAAMLELFWTVSSVESKESRRKLPSVEIYSTAPVYFFLADWQTEKVTVVRKNSPIKKDCTVIAFCEAPEEAKEVPECFNKATATLQHTTIKMMKK